MQKIRRRRWWRFHRNVDHGNDLRRNSDTNTASCPHTNSNPNAASADSYTDSDADTNASSAPTSGCRL